nr:MAG TPA: hypothetical protein [Caudoviricetes sp.]
MLWIFLNLSAPQLLLSAHMRPGKASKQKKWFKNSSGLNFQPRYKV